VYGQHAKVLGALVCVSASQVELLVLKLVPLLNVYENAEARLGQ
jgi:hypothetical protein